MQFYVKINGKEEGPVDSNRLKALADGGHIGRDDLVRKADDKRWHLAHSVKGLFDLPKPRPVTRENQNEVKPVAKEAEIIEPPALPTGAIQTPPQESFASRISQQARNSRKKTLIVCGAAVAVFVLTGSLVWMFQGESPEDAYEQIIAHGENGEWGDVWDRIDKKSQGKLEIALEMFAGMATAFGNRQDNKELESLSGRELFFRIAENKSDIQEQYTNRTVESVEVDRNRATLTVLDLGKDGSSRMKQTVHMLYEDGMWKLSTETSEHLAKGEADDADQQPSTKELVESDAETIPATVIPTEPEDSGLKPVTVNNADFRNVKWGMSEAQVKAQEQGEVIYDQQDAVGYNDQVAGLDCYVAYIFVQNKLVRARYIISEKHTNDNDFISDYSSLKKLLTEKYGRPTEDETLWKNDLYKDEPGHYGFAISLEHLLMYSKWQTTETEVFLGLTGDNFEISHQIEYHSKSLHSLEDETKKKQTLKDL